MTGWEIIRGRVRTIGDRGAPASAAFAAGAPERTFEERETADLTEQFGFVDYLKFPFHPFDILFVFMGLATAFGLVMRHTTQLQRAERQALRAERARAEDEDGARQGG